MIKAQSRSPLPAVPAQWSYWIKTARPFSLTATASPVLVGTAVAVNAGHFNPLVFLATMLSCLFLQIGANYFKGQLVLYCRKIQSRRYLLRLIVA